MKRDEVLRMLHEARAGFDQRVSAIPRRALSTPAPGRVHSPAETLVHVAAYEELIVDRLRKARLGATTAFDRDRVGWEEFNERIWGQAAGIPTNDALTRAGESFKELIAEVSALSDDELESDEGVTLALDPAWLQGRALWELIAIDGFEHYPMHYEALEEAAVAAASGGEAE
jgi:hypothetical protein